MSTHTTAVTPEQLGDLYLAAWHDHDPEAIVALHSPDSIFTSVATGKEATGRSAIRAAIADVFAAWPDLTFHPVRVYASSQVIVAEHVAEATQAVPLSLGDTTIEPNGVTVRFAVADILAIEDGLVTRKDSYVDMLGYVRAMRAAAAR